VVAEGGSEKAPNHPATDTQLDPSIELELRPITLHLDIKWLNVLEHKHGLTVIKQIF